MCGIAGGISLKASGAIDLTTIQKMSRGIRHRGPDDSGWMGEEGIGLVHQRLAIIDLESGKQPMTSADGQLSLIFNGEIYNYLELRKELQGLGCRFQTQSDTEVLLHAYQQWGLDFQSRLNGMWALAIWDRKLQQLLLSRDRLGQKPLFVYQDGQKLLFSSEIQAFRQAGVPLRPNLEVLELYLFLGYVPAPYSFWQGVSSLEPGEYWVIRQGRISQHRHWRLPILSEAELVRNQAEVQESFQGNFEDSIRLRMRADVPFGMFLSGGLDSSAILAKMSQTSSHRISTFTAGFEETRYDERDAASMVAQYFGADYHQVVLDDQQLLGKALSIFEQQGQPFADPAAIPTYALAKEARQQVKMVLTGDGADELLAGYSHFQSEKFYQSYRRIPESLQGMISWVMHWSARLSHGNMRYRFKRLERVFDSFQVPFSRRVVTKLAKTYPETITSLIRSKGLPIEEYLAGVFMNCGFEDPLNQWMYFNLSVSLPNQMLVKVDRMTMAHGLEARTPFLDHRLVDLLYRTDMSLKLPQVGKSKSLLRYAVRNEVPEQVLRQPKKGFAVPIREWLRDSKWQHLLQFPFLSGYLDQPLLLQKVAEHQLQKADHSRLLWRLLALEIAFSQVSIPEDLPTSRLL